MTVLDALKFFQADTEQISREAKRLMAAIDSLNSNVAALAADVKSLLAIPAPVAGVPEAEVQAAADAVAAIDAEVKAVLPAPPVA